MERPFREGQTQGSGLFKISDLGSTRDLRSRHSWRRRVDRTEGPPEVVDRRKKT